MAVAHAEMNDIWRGARDGVRKDHILGFSTPRRPRTAIPVLKSDARRVSMSPSVVGDRASDM
jgi:hypothetical protein